jgi:hypothetical protein
VNEHVFAYPTTQASNKERAIPPPLGKLSFTHIFGKALDERPDKAEVLSTSTILVGLPSPFAKSVCKMWVRIRDGGILARFQ